MWSAVVRNCGGRARRALGLQQRLALFARVAHGILDYRLTRWPASPSLHRSLDALQRRCLIFLVPSARRAGECMETWCRRKSRDAGKLARNMGLWSLRHVNRAHTWRSHMGRPLNRNSPAVVLYNFRDMYWRRERRLAMGSQSCDAGRLHSRACTHVCPRWQDSFIEA